MVAWDGAVEAASTATFKTAIPSVSHWQLGVGLKTNDGKLCDNYNIYFLNVLSGKIYFNIVL